MENNKLICALFIICAVAITTSIISFSKYNALAQEMSSASSGNYGKIMVNGTDVTSRYVSDLGTVKANLVVNLNNERLANAYAKYYTKYAISGQDVIIKENDKGKVSISIKVKISATVVNPILESVSDNLTVTNFVASQNEIKFNTNGTGSGSFVIENIKKKFYSLSEDEEPVIYSPVTNGKISYQFSQSEHEFEIKLSNEDLTPIPQTKAEVLSRGEIYINNEKVTEKFVDDPTELIGTFTADSSNVRLAEAYAKYYLKYLYKGCDVSLYYNGPGTTRISITVGVTAGVK